MEEMSIRSYKRWIPWSMAAARAALGPILIAGASCSWSPLALAGIVVTALLSDIFDGVLARRWGTDTAAVRLFDTTADTIFYLCTAFALYLARPEVLDKNKTLLGVLLCLEVLRLCFDFAKFGKAASYHSYLAKTWGLVMAVAVTAVFATGRANGLVPVALVLGIACNLEGLAMSLILPVWRRDVKGLAAALRLRVSLTLKVAPVLRRGFVAMAFAGCLLTIAAPAHAVTTGEAAYAGGTAPGIVSGTLGILDTVSAQTLAFRSKSAASSSSEIAIAYASIVNFQYATEVAHHIGVLPAIAGSLMKKRERKHLFTISYSDPSKSAQVAIFEVPKDEAPALLAILRARALQACGKMPVNSCGVVPRH